MEQLLSAILEHTSITGLLVPHFYPNDNPGEFTNLYHRVLGCEDKDLAFALLTKVNLIRIKKYNTHNCDVIIFYYNYNKKIITSQLWMDMVCAVDKISAL